MSVSALRAIVLNWPTTTRLFVYSRVLYCTHTCSTMRARNKFQARLLLCDRISGHDREIMPACSCRWLIQIMTTVTWYVCNMYFCPYNSEYLVHVESFLSFFIPTIQVDVHTMAMYTNGTNLHLFTLTLCLYIKCYTLSSSPYLSSRAPKEMTTKNYRILPAVKSETPCILCMCSTTELYPWASCPACDYEAVTVSFASLGPCIFP